MNKVSFIYLSQEEVKRSGGMDMMQAISDVEKVLVMRHKGECIVPHKVVLRKGTQEEESITGRINALPGYYGYSLTLWAWGSRTSWSLIAYMRLQRRKVSGRY